MRLRVLRLAGAKWVPVCNAQSGIVQPAGGGFCAAEDMR
jgi:hypothetical protein